MVPISLLVSLEVVRLIQKKIIQSDVSIYNTETDTPTRVQSCNLNEELGQIDYIFSDKTGTLTCNIMEFRKLSAGLKSYGSIHRLTDEQKFAQKLCDTEAMIPNVNFDTTEIIHDLRQGAANY